MDMQYNGMVDVPDLFQRFRQPEDVVALLQVAVIKIQPFENIFSPAAALPELLQCGIQAAVVTVRTKDSAYTDRVDFPKGEPENPLTDAEFRSRYDALMAYAGVDAADSAAVYEAVSHKSAPVDALVNHL